MKKIFTFLIIVLFTLQLSAISNGKNDDNRKKYKEAMKLFDKKNYDGALPILLDLSAKNPDNMNYKFLIGLSCFYSSKNKELAIPFLEMSSTNIKTNYVNNYKQTAAPVHTLYFLGQAYEYFGEYEKAIASYEKFKTYLVSHKYQSQLAEVDEHIYICKNALKSLANIQSCTSQNILPNQQSDINSNSKIMQTPDKKLKVNEIQNINPLYIEKTDTLQNKIQSCNEKNIIKYQIDTVSKQEVMKISEMPKSISYAPKTVDKPENKITDIKQEQPDAPNAIVKNESFIENNFYVQFAIGKIKQSDLTVFNNNVYLCKGKDGINRYISGTFSDYQSAYEYKKQIIELGYKDAWIAKKGPNYVDCTKLK